ncbi:hypothetical protein C8R44DRAFT_359630 [Mycena epipterygia]|nr:hypothetical protein C8R44DRAFT_359630 [Mycena epipterygia]
MDSDVEMVDPPGAPLHSPTSPRDPHVSPAHSRSKNVLDNLDDNGSPLKPINPDDDGPDDDNEEEAPDPDEPPPTTNDDDPDAPMDAPLSPTDAEEHDVDASDSENSSDDASEDDVDKDLIPDGDGTDTEAGEGKLLTAASWDDAAPDPALDAVNGGGDNGENGAIRIPMLVDAAPRSPSAGAVPPTSPLSAVPTPAKPVKKPKSHHAPPPPPPPAPPAPMQTIRLDIQLGGPDNYEIDVKGKARDEGFVWGELVSKKYGDEDTSDDGSDAEDADAEKEKDKDKDKDKDAKDADGDVEMDADGKPKPKKSKPKKSKKSKAPAEYYDVSDPFIDDSELAIDERTYFAQTKQKGFYVSSGEVALVRDKSPKKPKSRKKVGPALSLNLPTASTSALKPASGPKKSKSTSAAGAASKAPPSKAKGKALGTKESPIPLEDEDEDNKADVFGFGSAARKPSSSSVKGKEKAEEDGEEEAMAIAEGVNRMKGKWKERVSINGAGSGSAPVANGAAGANGDHSGEDKLRSASVEGDGEEDEVGKKRKRAVNGGGAEGAKKRRTVDITRFHPDLQASIERMKEAIAAESWETKSKFPPNLKPLLASLSLQAIALDEYDDEFFNLMPNIFPYNKFTMLKLIKRTIFHDHTALLSQRQDEILKQLQTLAMDGFPKAQEEWERSVQNYEEKRKEKAGRADGDPDPSVEGSAGPTRHPTEDPEVRVGSAGLSSAGDGDKGKGDDKEGPGKGGAHHGPPLKKYRMTEAMKNHVWQLVLLSNEVCRLENEKNSLEGSVLQVSEQGLRKVLYQKIVAVFPEGWMSSGQISRDVSAMKKKYEKEAQEE